MPGFRIHLALWTATVFLSWSQSTAQRSGAAENHDNLYTLRGTVINSVTGKPIARALVKLASQHKAVLTGREGDFSFEAVRGGHLSLLVTKPGFFRPGEALYQSRPLAVDLDSESGPILVKLLQEAVITGKVTGKDQEPIEGAVLHLVKEQIVQGRRELKFVQARAETDPEGNFRVDGLYPGVYYVGIRSARMDRQTKAAPVEEAYPDLIYYPGVTDTASATPIHVQAGQNQELLFLLSPVPTFKVSGKVAIENGWSLDNGPRLMEPTLGVLRIADRFDAKTGAFEFSKLPASKYVVQVTGKNSQGESSEYQRPVTVGSNISDLQIPLHSGIDIPVLISADFPRLLGHCSYTFRAPNGKYETRESDCSDRPQAHVGLSPIDIMPQMSFRYGLPTDNSDLSIHGVSPGKYWVRATAQFGSYVQSLRSGGVDLLVDPLVVPESGLVPAIEVTLRKDVGELIVRVRAAPPGKEIQVMALPDLVTRADPRMSLTGTGPDFHLRGLPPGAYRVYAFDSNDGLEFSNPEVLASYSSQAGSITVEPDGHASITVDLIHPDK
jgi:hypothetical protein